MRVRSFLLIFTVGLIAVSSAALALPVYARQMGVGCNSCHALSFGPSLTYFGRMFKLNGYSMGTRQNVPLSAMLVSSLSNVAKRLPEKPARHVGDNNDLVLNEVGLFFGGKITDHTGGFAQVTYSAIERDVAWDNVDFRYANTIDIGAQSAVVGISVNNSPTTQDLWNSTPVWGYPYIGSDLVPAPAASPLIAGGLGQQVLGATAYTMIADHLYLEGGFYHSLPNNSLDFLVGTSHDNPRPRNAVPYWRAVYQMSIGEHYLSAGVFELTAELQPDASAPNSDSYADFGYDATYQYNDGGNNVVNANVSYIREDQHLKQSSGVGDVVAAQQKLNALRADVTYGWHQTLSAGVGVFDTTGTRETGLYSPEQLVGSASGKPDTRGYTLQLEYIPWGKADSYLAPWANARLGIQYTNYDKFNGGKQNYDGFGRSASDNNTLLLFVWLSI